MSFPAQTPIEGSLGKRKRGLKFSFDDDDNSNPVTPLPKRAKVSKDSENEDPFGSMVPIKLNAPAKLEAQSSVSSLSSVASF